MGIPAYFSQIIKNHAKIIKQSLDNLIIHSLLIDANSIIYDVVHTVDNMPITDDLVIQCVIEQIQEYIDRIKPTELTYIAFDGVAPVAKMEQQKTRRYKTAFMNSVLPNTQESKKFDTMVISPGTPFMNLLATRIESAQFFGCPTVLRSTPKVWGEGEHKMFQYLRDNPMTNKNVVVYGLDADLIMLSLFHQQFCGSLYVCREKPSFIAIKEVLQATTDEKQLLYIDILALSQNILTEMNLVSSQPWRIYDYIFMCFFMGNDFLPAFPALNIRTNGIQRLMDTYRNCIGHIENRRLLSDKFQIQWKWVRLLIKELAKNEREFFVQEETIREQWQIQTISQLRRTKASLAEWLEATPILLKQAEDYVAPTEVGWEGRYNDVSFPDLPQFLSNNSFSLGRQSPPRKNQGQDEVVYHYLQGLEWVTRYYTEGCYNTVWKYPYAAAPLLNTLYNLSGFLDSPHTPLLRGGSALLRGGPAPLALLRGGPAPLALLHRSNHLFTEKEQLAAIVPPTSYAVVGLPLINNSIIIHPEFTWNYKRYFWEAHLA